MLFFYQGLSNIPCIYEIRNTHSGRRYVGQTKNPKLRWGSSGHKGSLLANKHKNLYMQHDFNKCFQLLGHTDFLEFHILEPLPNSTPKDRDDRETYWVSERLSDAFELYNMTSGGNANKTVSVATKATLSAVRKGKTYEELYGVARAEEIKQKIRENKLVEMNRPEVKENLRKQLSGKTEVERYGEEKAALVKQKRSRARKGRYLGTDSSRYRVIENITLKAPDGTLYYRIEGIKDFAELHGLSRNHLSELLAGKRKTHRGWQLVIHVEFAQKVANTLTDR